MSTNLGQFSEVELRSELSWLEQRLRELPKDDGDDRIASIKQIRGLVERELPAGAPLVCFVRERTHQQGMAPRRPA